MSRVLTIVLLVAMLVAGGLVVAWLAGVPPFAERAAEPETTPASELLDAAEAGEADIVAQALASGVDANAADPFGRSALMLAAAGGHDEVVRALLAAGADVQVRSQSGWTALMFAVDGAPSATTALILLNAGSDPHVADAEGRRALDLARDHPPVRNSSLWARLEELTAWPDELTALTGGDAFVRGWPSMFLVPIDGATISSRASHLPGAPRGYRNGTHEGFDFYDGTVSVEIAYGTPQRAAAAGVVVRADRDYVEHTPSEYEDLIARATGSLSTPPEVLDALRGRQVWIRHPGGFVTRYAHLSDVADDVAEGARVRQGQVIGFTGNSGTIEAAEGGRDDPHPHLELWRGEETYLGRDMEPGAIYAVAAQVFGLEALPPFTDGGLTF